MPQTEKPSLSGCSCVSDPFADLPPELRPANRDEAAKRQRFGLRRVTCPGCGLVHTTNRTTDLCMDCERKGVKVPLPIREKGETGKMLTIKVLGPGCSKCEFLAERAQQALEMIKAEYPNLQATVEKVADVDVFLQYGLMVTPGLVINEKLVCAGKVASVNAIADWIREALDGSV